MNPLYICEAVLICFDNDNDAYIPELWANESLAILEENMVMANLVHRDFQDQLAQFGDVVNTRRPSEHTGRRRTDADTYTAADVSATNVRVSLDQWFYDSFIIKDGEASKSFKDLVAEHIAPAMLTMSRNIDRAVLGRVHDFLNVPTRRAGRLGAMSASTAQGYIADAKTILSKNKAPEAGRKLCVSPDSENGVLMADVFVRADARGDGGSALEQARMGRIYGFDTFMAQNVNAPLASGAEVVAGTITNAEAADETVATQPCTVTGYEVVLGEFVTVAGNDQPTYITAATASTNTTAVTLNEANKYATLALAVATVYKSADVNGSSYAIGYAKEVLIDGHAASKNLQVGQLVAFGTSTARRTYTVIEATATTTTSTSVLLDRPLEVALTDNQVAFPGPAGSMNLAFCRNAMALVTRSLALPPSAFGVAAATASYNGVGMRVVMQYDSLVGGTRVNLDILAGTAVLDVNQACVILG